MLTTSWWLVSFQQQTQPGSGIVDNPITVAALLSIMIAALAPHAGKIAGAIADAVINIIKSLAGIVEEWQRGMKARNDIIVELKEQIQESFKQQTVLTNQVTIAQQETTKAQAETTKAQSNTNEAQKNANESLRLANEATANLDRVRAANVLADNQIKALEKEITEERNQRIQAELRANTPPSPAAPSAPSPSSS